MYGRKVPRPDTGARPFPRSNPLWGEGFGMRSCSPAHPVPGFLLPTLAGFQVDWKHPPASCLSHLVELHGRREQ